LEHWRSLMCPYGRSYRLPAIHIPDRVRGTEERRFSSCTSATIGYATAASELPSASDPEDRSCFSILSAPVSRVFGALVDRRPGKASAW